MNETVGIIIAAIVVIAGFVGVIVKVMQPINDLNLNIVKLTASIDRLIANDRTQDTRISNHGHEIDDLKLKNENLEGRIRHLESITIVKSRGN